jgi:hypothetical protein
VKILQRQAEKSGAEEIEREVNHVRLVSGLFATSTDSAGWKASHKEAQASIDGWDYFNVGVALFDSGASADNYISSALVEKLGLGHHVEHVASSVKVADGREVPIRGKINLLIRFKNKQDEFVKARLDLYLLDGLSMSIVIGIQSILNHYMSVFIDMLLENAQSDTGMLQNLSPIGHANVGPDLVSEEEMKSVRQAVPSILAYSTEECEEEFLIPEPCSFTAGLNFLGMTLEEAENEYQKDIYSRVDPTFAEFSGVMEFLTSYDCMRVFVPDNWNGINGIADLKFEFTEDMPNRIRPAQRPIPHKIFAAAKEEFFRMIQYFYEESNSPMASPVVFAPKSTHPFIRCCGDYRLINKYIKTGHYPIPDVIKELHKASGFTIFVDLDVRNAFHELKLHKDFNPSFCQKE